MLDPSIESGRRNLTICTSVQRPEAESPDTMLPSLLAEVEQKSDMAPISRAVKNAVGFSLYSLIIAVSVTERGFKIV